MATREEVVALAIRVLGGRPQADEWLARTAMGLDGQRPVDLLESPDGLAKVEELLRRLLHGVYT